MRDEKGQPVQVREFARGEVVELAAEELVAVANDIGKALQAVEWSDEYRKFRPIDLVDLDLPGLVQSIKDGTYVEPTAEAEEETGGAEGSQPMPSAKKPTPPKAGHGKRK